MPAILGSGEYRYRVVENWAKLPDGWSLTDAASVQQQSREAGLGIVRPVGAESQRVDAPRSLQRSAM